MMRIGPFGTHRDTEFPQEHPILNLDQLTTIVEGWLDNLEAPCLATYADCYKKLEHAYFYPNDLERVYANVVRVRLPHHIVIKRGVRRGELEDIWERNGAAGVVGALTNKEGHLILCFSKEQEAAFTRMAL